MNVVALRSLPAGGHSPPALDRRITRVEIFRDMAAAEPYWRALEKADTLGTPYQRFDFLKLWQRHVADAGMSAFIVVGFNAAQ